MTDLTRRSLLRTSAAAGTAALAGFPALAQSREITVTALGGVWEEAVRKSFVAPFEQKTGAKANVLLGSPPQWLSQVEANPQNPPIDVIIATPDLAISAAKTDLLDTFTTERLPNLADIPEEFTKALSGKGTVFDYGVAGITYNKKTVKNPPKSFREFVDRTAAGEWTASLPGLTYAVTPIMLIWTLAKALGGGVENVDPFFQAMARMRKNVVFWGGPNDFFNHLSSGEADLGIYFDGRTWAHVDAGADWMDFVNPSEGGSINALAVIKPKNAKPLAWDYVDVMLSPEAQLRFATMLNYPVTNRKVVYPDALKRRFTPWQQAHFPPYEEIAKVRSAWVDRWNREIRG
ncbi:twin-arginine translocation pathway signal [Methylobacterium currus]|uniref:Twin-arginine translocation pathway signal n=1 Tax=Methylobacterium currus TaxID=2051553 RepID=A0A2R4WLL6_9HYPH|nr:extracellular solute-binding protein [Methylobacterium currus]AWB22429.1 twin-arginine translocation pathway signal [Methylobacterium currus]